MNTHSCTNTSTHTYIHIAEPTLTYTLVICFIVVVVAADVVLLLVVMMTAVIVVVILLLLLPLVCRHRFFILQNINYFNFSNLFKITNFFWGVAAVIVAIVFYSFRNLAQRLS